MKIDKNDCLEELQIDLQTYTKEEITQLGMKPLPVENHNMQYLVFEKDDKIYFFEEIEDTLLRLYCITSRRSFYLS